MLACWSCVLECPCVYRSSAECLECPAPGFSYRAIIQLAYESKAKRVDQSVKISNDKNQSRLTASTKNATAGWAQGKQGIGLITSKHNHILLVYLFVSSAVIVSYTRQSRFYRSYKGGLRPDSWISYSRNALARWLDQVNSPSRFCLFGFDLEFAW